MSYKVGIIIPMGLSAMDHLSDLGIIFTLNRAL